MPSPDSTRRTAWRARLPARALAVLLIAELAAGCGAWRQLPLPEPAPDSPEQDLGAVRVHLVDGRAVDLEQATADADSLRGEFISDQRRPSLRMRLAFARADVRAVERHGLSARRTGLVLLGIGAACGIALAIWAATRKDTAKLALPPRQEEGSSR